MTSVISNNKFDGKKGSVQDFYPSRKEKETNINRVEKSFKNHI